MKGNTIRPFFALLVSFLLLTSASFAQNQGKVVINEYMPWTSNGCGTTAEFVELMNFGPGPVNIGCYILTTGIYAVTIPPNTILKPGEYYILAGQNFIPGNCANIDSTSTGVTADLNWNTCNCTNVPIPTTGSGMMVDGGNANTPLVLLDPALNIIDAIVRNTPTEPVSTIISSSVAGSCTPKTFNIGTMNPNYEVLGMSAGRGNSFGRTLDGDCNWLKDPQQSGNATNNRSGRVTDITYELDIVKPTSCQETGYGSVSIYVKHSSYSSIFPMTYTIVRDVDSNFVYDFNDQYNTYYDYEPPFIEIENLPVGRFKVVVSSVKGCYLKAFEIPIIPCDPGTLPVRLVYFKNTGFTDNSVQLEWLLQDVQNLQSVVVERAGNNGFFTTERVFAGEQGRGTRQFGYQVTSPQQHYYRLKITQKSGETFYSPVINTLAAPAHFAYRISPNPATTHLNIDLGRGHSQRLTYSIYSSSGLVVGGGTLPGGLRQATIPLPPSMQPGVYQLQLTGNRQPFSYRFVKH